VREYDFWLFDLDGTLVDVDGAYARRTLARVSEHLECDFTESERTTLWHAHDSSRQVVLDRYGVSLEAFWDAFDRLDEPAKRADATFLYDDARHVADIDVPVGLVTHCPRPVSSVVLDTLGIRDWFDTVVVCSEEMGWKPDPDPVWQAINQLDLPTRLPQSTRDPPSQPGTQPATQAPVGIEDGGVPIQEGALGALSGALVGDNPVDIGAAWNAGLDAVHIERRDPNARGSCVLGDHRINSVAALLEPVEQR